MIELPKLSEGLRVMDIDLEGGAASDEEILSKALSAIREVRPERVVVAISRDLSPEHATRVAEVGGFVYRKPAGFTEALHAHDYGRAADLLFGGADWTSDWPGFAAGDPPSDAASDLSVYENPPFQLDTDDYERWLERMRTPPELLED